MALRERHRPAASARSTGADVRAPLPDAGFTLIETMMSIFVIGLVMSALTSFFVSTTAVVSQQSGLQTATQIATSAIGNIRGMKGTALLAGLDQSTYDDQWDEVDAVAAAYLEDTMRITDLPATVSPGPAQPPTVARTVPVDGVAYRTRIALGRCWQALAAGPCDDNPSTGPAAFFRVVLAVTWADRRCRPSDCSYVTSTLVSSMATEPVFNSNGGGGPAPQIIATAQSGAPNSPVNYQLTTTPGGQCPLSFGFSGLPAGVSGSSGGLLTGTLPGSAGSHVVSVTLRDASNAIVDATSFTWTVTSPGPYPSQVTGHPPWAYHRLEDPVSSAATSAVADTSGNGRAGVFAGRTNGAWTAWQFDEGSGTIAGDSSGVVNIGTLGGAGATWSTAGRFGGALSLNGTSTGYVASTGPAVATNASFTVSAWVYPTMSNPAGSINAVLTQSGTNSGFYLQQNGGNWKFAIPDADTAVSGGATVEDPDPITLNTWTHLVGVYDSAANVVSLYVNGVSKGTPAARSGTWNATGALQAGRAKWNGGFVDHWQGRLDEVRAYRRALSPTEVRVMYGDEIRYDFSEASGTSTADAGDRRSHGTLGSAASFTTGHSGNAVTMSDNANGYVQGTGKGVHTSSSYTVSAWVNLHPSGTGVDRAIVSQPGTTSSPFILKYDSGGKWRIDFPRSDTTGPPDDHLESTGAAATNTWVHLVGVYDDAADLGKLYVNSTLVDSNAQTEPTEWEASGPLQVGRARWNGAYTQRWYGRIDTVRAYQRALSQAEINSLYAGTGPSDPTAVFVEAPMTAGVRGALTGAYQSSTAVAFNGTSNAYNNTPVSNPGPFTIEGWFRAAGTAGGSIIGFSASQTGMGAENKDRLIFLDGAGKLNFFVFPGAAKHLITTASYNDGAWHHVVGSVGADGMKLYVDGVRTNIDPSVSTAQNFTGYWRWGGNSLAGFSNQPPNDYFTGTVDEVAIYPTQLTDQQVISHYQSN